MPDTRIASKNPDQRLTDTDFNRRIKALSTLTAGLSGATQTYAASNVTTDRTYDANATTVDEIADVLGTLIADLRTKGIVN